jgi:hypothetical protein
MFKTILGALVAFALIASQAAAGDKKKPRPGLTPQVLDAMYAAQENLIRLKFRSLQVYNQRFIGPGIPPVRRKG